MAPKIQKTRTKRLLQDDQSENYDNRGEMREMCIDQGKHTLI